jgi:hypothetical protein
MDKTPTKHELSAPEAKYLQGIVDTINAFQQRFAGARDMILQRDGLAQSGEDTNPWAFDGKAFTKTGKEGT